MRDLKQRLFDLLRSGGISVGDSSNNNNSNNNNSSSNNNSNNNNSIGIVSQMQQQQQQQLYSPIQPLTKPKKLHEYTAADCNAAFLRKYHDLSISRELERKREQERQQRESNGASNVIYFNENLSMTSKYNVRQFPLTRYPSCPLSSFGISPEHEEGSAGSSLAEEEEEEHTESDRYNFCSDEDQSSNAHTLKFRYHKMQMDSDVDADVDPNLDDEHAESQLDSFCTLCTSTFSYNKCCRFCDNSICGSKCNSERGSHASRLSCNRNGVYGGIDGEFDPNSQHLHQHQQRFGGSMRLLASQQSTMGGQLTPAIR